jgi:hypothetical protein
MSTVGQQRSMVQYLATHLDWTKLKRAGVISRRSEGEHIIQMLHDAVQTLNTVPEPARTKQEPSW